MYSRLSQAKTYSLRRDKLVGNILKSLGHFYCIISFAYMNNVLSIGDISRSELRRMATKGLWKLRTNLGVNSRDSRRADTS